MGGRRQSEFLTHESHAWDQSNGGREWSGPQTREEIAISSSILSHGRWLPLALSSECVTPSNAFGRLTVTASNIDPLLLPLPTEPLLPCSLDGRPIYTTLQDGFI